MSFAELVAIDQKFRETLSRSSVVSLDPYAEYELEDMDWAGPLGLAVQRDVDTMERMAIRMSTRIDLDFLETMNKRGNYGCVVYGDVEINGQVGARDERVVCKTAE
jgi:hypothetical protein